MTKIMQLVAQIEFSESGLTMEMFIMFIITEYSIYGQDSEERMYVDQRELIVQ